MYHANQSSVSFSELKGLSFIVLDDIGPWRQIIQQEIPDASFFIKHSGMHLLKSQSIQISLLQHKTLQNRCHLFEQFDDDDNRIRIHK